MNIENEILALLDSLKCKYNLKAGIYTVTTPEGVVWDFTQPLKIQDAFSEILTASNVSHILRDCLFNADEMDGNTPKAEIEMVQATGVVGSFGFHEERLESHWKIIKGFLEQLPDEFRQSKGGGCSFLNMCNRKDGEQWGEHRNMDELLCLGLGLGMIQYPMPRETWQVLPGGMPYVVYLDGPAKKPKGIPLKATHP
jgi:hypothetical protein